MHLQELATVLMNYHVGRLVLSSLCVGDFAAADIWWCSFCTTQRTENKTTDVVIHQHSRRLLKMDILMSEACWAHNNWNKITSDIKLVFHSSTNAMMHFAINIRFVFCCDGRQPCWTTKNAVELQLVASRLNSKFFENLEENSARECVTAASWRVIIVGAVCTTFFSTLKHELHVPWMPCRFILHNLYVWYWYWHLFIFQKSRKVYNVWI